MQAEGVAQKPLSAPPSRSDSAAMAFGARWRKRDRSEANVSERAKLQRPKGTSSSHGGREHRYDSSETSSLVGRDGGLCNLASVDRLINIMQHEKVQKAVDQMTNRIMLARVVAATAEPAILTKFLKLGGLAFFDQWLHEALKAYLLCESNDDDDDDHEDGDAEKRHPDLFASIVAALEKLPVDLVVLKSCPIAKTVKSLRSHRDPDIQRRAKKLVDLWKRRVDAEMKQTTACDTTAALSNVSSEPSFAVAGNQRRDLDVRMPEKSSSSEGHGLRQIKAEAASNWSGFGHSEQSSGWCRADLRKGERSSAAAMSEQSFGVSTHRRQDGEQAKQGYGGHRQEAEVGKVQKPGNNIAAPPLSGKFASVATLCSSPDSSRKTKSSPSLQIDSDAQVKAMASVLLRPRSRSSPHSKNPLHGKIQPSAPPSPGTALPLSPSPDPSISRKDTPARRPLRRRDASTPQWSFETLPMASTDISDGISLLANIAASESSMNDATKTSNPPSCKAASVEASRDEVGDPSGKARSRKEVASDCLQAHGGAAVSEVTVERDQHLDRISSSVSSPSEADSQLDAMAGESRHPRSACITDGSSVDPAPEFGRRRRPMFRTTESSSVGEHCVHIHTSQDEKRVDTAGDSSVTDVVDPDSVHGSSTVGDPDPVPGRAAVMAASLPGKQADEDHPKQKDWDCSRISSPATDNVAAVSTPKASPSSEDGSNDGLRPSDSSNMCFDADGQVPVGDGRNPDSDKKMGLAFDLNETVNNCDDEGSTNPSEVCESTEPAKHQMGTSAISAKTGALSGPTVPIAVMAAAAKGPFPVPVPASRPIAELGWKGSAATSAFRPTLFHYRRAESLAAEQAIRSPALKKSTVPTTPAQSVPSPANHESSMSVVTEQGIPFSSAKEKPSNMATTTEQAILSSPSVMEKKSLPEFDLNVAPDSVGKQDDGGDNNTLLSSEDAAVQGPSPRRSGRNSHVWDLNETDEAGLRAPADACVSNERAKVSFDLNDGPSAEDHDITAEADLRQHSSNKINNSKQDEGDKIQSVAGNIVPAVTPPSSIAASSSMFMSSFAPYVFDSAHSWPILPHHHHDGLLPYTMFVQNPNSMQAPYPYPLHSTASSAASYGAHFSQMPLQAPASSSSLYTGLSSSSHLQRLPGNAQARGAPAPPSPACSVSAMAPGSWNQLPYLPSSTVTMVSSDTGKEQVLQQQGGGCWMRQSFDLNAGVQQEVSYGGNEQNRRNEKRPMSVTGSGMLPATRQRLV